MSKVKKGTIFKIFIVTLLIILSTMSISSARITSGEIVESQTMSEISSGSGPELDGDGIQVDLSTLDGSADVLCSGKGIELNSKSKVDGRPDYGTYNKGDIITDDSSVTEDVKSKYVYDKMLEAKEADAVQAFILAHTSTAAGAGSHSTRATQQAWWSMIANRGGTGVFLFYSPESPDAAFAQYEDTNLLDQLEENNSEVYDWKESFDEYLIDNGFEDLKLSIDENCAETDYYSVINYLVSSEEFRVLDETSKINILEQILDNFVDKEALLEMDADENGKNDYAQMLDELIDYAGEDEYFGDQNLYDSAVKFSNFVNKYLDDAGNLKSDYEIKIDDSRSKVRYDEEYQSYLVGPLQVNYPGYIPSQYGMISGLTGANLVVDDSNRKLEFVPNAAITALTTNQFTFIMSDKVEGYNYPLDNKDFYIAFKYDEQTSQITSFTLDYNWMYYEGAFDYYVGEYETYEWEKYDVYVPTTWKSYNYSGYNPWSTSVGAEIRVGEGDDVPKATTPAKYGPIWSDYYQEEKYYYKATYYTKVRTEYECSSVTIGVSQPLSVNRGARLYYRSIEAGVELPWSKTIELTKIVKDVDGNEIASETEFPYMVIMDPSVGVGSGTVRYNEKDYTIVNEGTIKAGDTISIQLPPLYLEDFGGTYPEYHIIEIDENGKKYSEWEQNNDSLWSKYKPNNDGVAQGDGDSYTLINVKNKSHSHLKIDKKIKEENADGTEVEFEIIYTYEDGSSKTNYIKLKPDSNSTWFETTFTDGTPAGYIQTGAQDGYAFAKFISYPIEWKGEVAPRYSVTEVDQNKLSYEKYTDLSIETKNLEEEIKSIEKELSEVIYDNLSEQEKAQYNSKLTTLHRKMEELEIKKVTLHNSIWNKFEAPETNNTSGSFEDYICGCDGTKTGEALNVATTTVSSFKNSLGPTEFSLTIEKRNKNLTAQYEAKFDVELEGVYFGDMSDENPTSSTFSQYIDTLVVTSDSGETDIASATINNPIKNYKYFITVTEQESDYKWIDYVFDRNETKENVYVLQDGENIIQKAAENSDKWILRIVDGTIVEATKVLKDNAENNFSLVAINNGLERFTGLVIEKTVVDTSYNIDYEQYPEAFYFKLQKFEHGGYKDWDAVKDLFGTENGIIKVTRNENNEYKLASNIIPLSVNVNPKEAIPTIKLIEVDQYGEEYSENPTNEDSIWNSYIPLTTEVIKGLDVYTTQEAAEAAKADNKLTVMSQQNAKIYSGTIEISKALSAGSEWEDDAKFYFTIDVLNDSMDCESIVKEYFDDEFIAENGEKGYHGSKPVVVITKENQTVKSNLIEWTSNLENPKFVIREVDQYGCSWHGSEDKIENEDSTWYDYQPSGKNKYNTVTAQILPGENVEYSVNFENAPQKGTITINKVISNSDFLEHEKFYFKVEENGKDVTADLFDSQYINENGYVVVTHAQKDTGITSKEQIGKHTYTITEYDENGVTYEEYKDGTSSEFWGAGFIPSNNGVWTVDLNSSDGPEFIEAVNYRVVDLEVIKEITGDITEEDRNQEFTADLVIAPRSTTGDIWVKDSNGEFKSYEYGYIDRITLSANNPYTLEGIAWEGDSPYCFVSEIDLPEGWTLVGYEPSDIDLKADSSLNKLKIINKKETEMTLQITKNIVDLDGKLITLEQDSPTFYFDVLAKDIEAGDTILVDGKETVVDGTVVDDGYTRLTKLEIVVPAGQSSKTVTIQGINGNNLDYKIVEVDQYGEEYSENPAEDSIWKTTKPTVYSNGKWGSIDGIWTGTISNADGAPLVAKIDAYNTIRKVDINFTKMVKDEDGNMSPIEPDEIFYYIAEFSNDEKYEFSITYDETTKGATTWHKEFILDLDETLTYKITEVDENGDTFENRKETSVLWNNFKPTDGDGIEEDTVEPNTNPELWLVGMNTPIDNSDVFGELKLTKTANNSGDQEFYFIVEQNEKGNVVTSLFEKSVITYIGENKDIPAVAIKAGEEVFSKVQTWKEDENAPTFTVKEVDQYGQTYLLFTELGENKQEDSLWNDWIPTNNNGKGITLLPAYSIEQLESTAEDVLEDGVTIQEATEVTIFNETNIKVQPFTIIKKVDNSPIADGENFYFIITKDGSQVTGEELEKLFPNADIVDNKIHLYKDGEKTVDSATSISVDITNHKYVITEVDASGAQYSTTPAEGSLWNEYSVENGGKWEVTEEQPDIIVNNEKIDENIAKILISKQLLEGQEWQDGQTFNFILFVDGEEYPIELTKDNPTTEPPIEVTWKENEDAPKISVQEIGFTPTSIKLNGNPYTSDVELVPNNEYQYTFTFENDAIETGYLNVTKKLPEGVESDETFVFEYKYSNEEQTRTLEIKAGETKATEPTSWAKGTTPPTYTIKEIDKVPLEITTTDTDAEAVTEGDNPVGITGTLEPGSNGNVSVTFVNDTEWYKGYLNVIKEFQNMNKMSTESFLDVIKTYYSETYNEDYKFTFKVYVEPGDGNSVFKYNGTTYSTNTEIESKTISISEFINNYESACKIFENITVEWPEGSIAPKFTVIEENTGTFWAGNIVLNGGNSFENEKTIEVKINNVYKEVEHWDLTTKLAGIVWEDATYDNKSLKDNISGDADGKYDPNVVDSSGNQDKLMSGVYVRVARLLLKDGYEVDRTYNSQTHFILDEVENYYEVIDGHWNYDKVSVPAFKAYDIESLINKNIIAPIYGENETDEAKAEKMEQAINALYGEGYRIRYDVEFFYDGVTYQPTKPVNAADYMNDSENEAYFITSSAIENLNDRNEFNNKYTTVTGNTLMDSEGNSTGKLEGNTDVTADIDYKGNIEFESESELYVNIAEGTLNFGDNPEANLMKATTGNNGLTYFFNGEMWIETEENGRVWIDDTGMRLDITPANSLFKENTNIEYSEELGVDAIITEKEYVRIYDYALNINLGLVKKPQVDLELEKKIVAATIIVNENAQVYPLNSDINQDTLELGDLTEDQQKELEDLFLKLQDQEQNFNIYTSDYNYRTSVYEGTKVYDAYNKFYEALYGYEDVEDLIKTKELQIYLTYGISIANKSGIYDVEINSITDYYDSTLSYVDVKTGYDATYTGYVVPERNSGLWAYVGEADKTATLTDIFKEYEKLKTNSFKEGTEFIDEGTAGSITYNDEEYTFNKATITLKENKVVPANARKIYYTTYRVDRYDISDNGLILGIKPNIAEINEFSTYYTTNYAKLLGYNVGTEENPNRYSATSFDKDSAPGNYNFTDYPNCFEDDTDFAQVNIVGGTTDPRTISGTAWLDKDGNYSLHGQNLGDSQFNENEDYWIENINTQLVEVIDIPNVDDAGNITDIYTEYEFYWDEDSTTTDENGKYSLNSTTIDSMNYKGLVPGNYVVRFFYGDQDTTVKGYKHDEDGNIVYEKDEDGNEKPVPETIDVPIINGIDYKTTAYEYDIDNTEKEEEFGTDLINTEWQEDIYKDKDDQNINDNTARDNEARRLQLIKETQELDNSKTAIFDVANYANIDEYVADKVSEYAATMGMLVDEVSDAKIREFGVDYIRYKESLYGTISIENGTDAYNGLIRAEGYSMFADTAKLNLKVESDKTIEEKPEGKALEAKGYDIAGINLGLEERSKTEIYLDKQIKEITLTTSSDKTFFHVEYEVEYSTEGGLGWTQVDDKLYVKLTVKEDTVIGENNLQTLNDNWTLDSITQGFRYINIDSTVLQGLKLEIKYQITAINLSETDTYGQGLYDIIYEENDNGDVLERSIENRNEKFEEAIDKLSSNEYTLDWANASDGRLNFAITGLYKTYGEYLGHTYYQGFRNVDWSDSNIFVTTTVREIVDYIDNDIEVDTALINENGQMWDVTNSEELADEAKLDKYVYDEEKIVDDSEDPYLTILVSADSKDANSEFVKELKPLASCGDEAKLEDNKDIATATIGLTTSKIFASTDEGETGMDNFAEILMIENTVGRRDIDTVYGNYNPRGGATQTTERDETATEIVTLSPPTGNIENDRAMITYIAILSVIAVLAGAGVGIKLKKSEKSSKSDKTE